ncbi:DNA polymerase III subunit delta [Calderihabitans maritimus]|uniref:DNA polymerase III subunit delta n=1 Tax=Calderihabitans maritimus TaxID=1246530 RepID=A0A1Z5HVA0_9FIRM|nr:DNA polymerase III subunit delta [Calderihabitans maritimus]GAW93463.1 DNA polymerase III subunit delta [Calderihabitans maritimus]
MNYQQLLTKIEKNEIAPVYLFYGEEKFLFQEVLEALKNKIVTSGCSDFNYDVLDGSEVPVARIVEAANTLPVLAERRLVVVKEAEMFRSRSAEKSGSKDEEKMLLDYLSRPLPSTCLVFTVEGKVDARKRLYRAVQEKGEVVNFPLLKGKALSAWVKKRVEQRGKRIEFPALQYLVAAVGENLFLLENEIEKICTFLGDKDIITLSDITDLISKTEEGNIFRLVDAIGERKTEKAVLLMREMLNWGEPPLKILFMIARQFRLMLQVKGLLEKGFSEKQIARELQLHPYVAQKCLQQSRNFSRANLEEALRRMLELDIAVKTGQGDPVYLMEIALLSLNFPPGSHARNV